MKLKGFIYLNSTDGNILFRVNINHIVDYFLNAGETHITTIRGSYPVSQTPDEIDELIFQNQQLNN